MKSIISFAKTWVDTYRTRQDDEAGQTALEYALVVAVVSIVLVGALVGFGTDLIGEATDAVGDLADIGGD